ncbi:MAG: hypothetical protein HS110_11580 [Zoogloeaceae bacterium]|nr:hypothetical protein [Zoogloeaceae bacterium]MCK6384524.1 hypothetical protein [Rhodocyclaceae bacterium]
MNLRSRKARGWNRPAWRRKALPLALLALSMPPVCAAERLEDNATVLAQFAQAAGGAAPELVAAEDGTTKIEWQGGATVDFYSRSASGGATLTPYSGGHFHRIGLQSDLRGTAPEGDVAWAQFALTQTDDSSAILLGNSQINTLSAGRAGLGYRVAFGDVAVNHSSLGANLPLRGLLAQRYFGQTLVSASAGVVAESWEALADQGRRRMFLKNAYAFKAESPFGQNLQAYATVQGYREDGDSVGANALALMPSSGHTATAGLNWREGQYYLQAEGGLSRYGEKGLDGHRDRALIVDGGWQGDKLGLRAGHHDLGRYYASLSGLAGAGIRESYANANWQAAQWMSLTGDLRRSENQMAAPPVPPPPATIPPTPVTPYTPFVGKTEAANLRAQFTFADVPGLGLALSAGESHGKSSAGGSNRNANQGASLSYVRPAWNASLGYQNAKLSNSVAGTDSRSDTWSVVYGRSWSDATEVAPAAWMLNATASGSFQRQHLENGTTFSLNTLNLVVMGERSQWGRLSAILGGSRGHDATGGTLRQHWYQLDAGRALGQRGGIRLYLRALSSYQEQPAIAYRDKTAGVQLSYAF